MKGEDERMKAKVVDEKSTSRELMLEEALAGRPTTRALSVKLETLFHMNEHKTGGHGLAPVQFLAAQFASRFMVHSRISSH